MGTGNNINPEDYAGHTPGPWEYYGESVNCGLDAIDRSKWTTCVCKVSTRLRLPESRRVANARLIAAAPDLLAEVVRLREQVAELEGNLRTLGSVEGEAFNCHIVSADQTVNETRPVKFTVTEAEPSTTYIKSTMAFRISDTIRDPSPDPTFTELGAMLNSDAQAEDTQ